MGVSGEYHKWKSSTITNSQEGAALPQNKHQHTNTHTLAGNEWWWGSHNIAIAAEKHGWDKHTQTKE